MLEHISGNETGRQMILDGMVGGIPLVQSAPDFFMNAICMCYGSRHFNYVTVSKELSAILLF